MNSNERAKALKIIEDTQRNAGITGGTNSVTVEIGHVADNGQVKHDSLLLHNAPGKILSELQDNGYSLSVKDSGVKVTKY